MAVRVGENGSLPIAFAECENALPGIRGESLRCSELREQRLRLIDALDLKIGTVDFAKLFLNARFFRIPYTDSCDNTPARSPRARR